MSVTDKRQTVSEWRDVAPRHWGLRVVSKTIRVNTVGDNDVQDLTRPLRDLLTKVGMRDGTATLFIQGSTAGITTIEFEPGVVADLKEMFERVAPNNIAYKHEARWHDGNGHSHIRAALLGASLVIPFVSGQLTLGTWQQIVLVDFDNRPRQRDIVVQFMGN
jgi:secondary thiamine-phosphate synthase enzyme